MRQNDIKKEFAKYVALNIVGMLGLSCYILADTFFIAQGIGAQGLAALNIAIPVYSFIHGTGLMIGIGGATRFSISNSKGIFTQSLYYAGLMASIFVVLGLFFSRQIAALLGADAQIIQDTTIYIKTILCFSPLFLLNNVIICYVRNDRAPKLSMIAMLVGSFSNIILDYILIFPFDMGMFGAAFATGLAPFISLLILSIHFIRRRNAFGIINSPPSLKKLADISSLGVSALITEVSSGIVIIVFNLVILGIAGNIGVAAYGVIANIALVIIAIFTGISQGTQPVVSRCCAMGDMDDTKKVLRYGVITSVGIAVVIYLLSVCYPEQIISAFNKNADQNLTDIAINGLYIYFTAFVFCGINILLATYFSAIGKPKNGFIISLLRGFVLIIPTALVLSELMGINGVWLAVPLTELIVMIISIFIARRVAKA